MKALTPAQENALLAIYEHGLEACEESIILVRGVRVLRWWQAGALVLATETVDILLGYGLLDATGNLTDAGRERIDRLLRLEQIVMDAVTELEAPTKRAVVWRTLHEWDVRANAMEQIGRILVRLEKRRKVVRNGQQWSLT